MASELRLSILACESKLQKQQKACRFGCICLQTSYIPIKYVLHVSILCCIAVMLEGLGLRGGWYGSWSAATAAAACQIRSPPTSTTTAGSAAASRSGGVTVGSSNSSAAAAKDGSSSNSDQQERCSLGQQFLQGYLESLGSYNTFG